MLFIPTIIPDDNSTTQQKLIFKLLRAQTWMVAKDFEFLPRTRTGLRTLLKKYVFSVAKTLGNRLIFSGGFNYLKVKPKYSFEKRLEQFTNTVGYFNVIRV